MGIHTTANKYKESTKGHWVKGQCTPPDSGRKSVISMAGQNMNDKLQHSFSADKVMKNAYNGYLGGNQNIIIDTISHRESKHGKNA